MRRQCTRAWAVRHLLLHLQQPEHLLQIDQALLHFPVHEPQEVQRLIKLHQVGVHQHELAHCHRAGAHPLRRQQHDRRQPDGDDRRLTQVQHVQRHLALHCGLFIARQRCIETCRFVPLVAEILHGLVVEQAVDGAGACLVVGVVHRAADPHTDIGEAQRETEIGTDRRQRQQREPPVEQAPDDGGDHQHLEHSRDDVEDRQPQNCLNAGGAAIDDARQTTGLAVEMKTQRQSVQVLEGLQRQFAGGALLHRSEDGVTQFTKSLGTDTQQPVRDDQCGGNGQHAARQRVAFWRQHVNRAAIHDRHQDGGAFGQDQEYRRDDDPAAAGGLVLRPQVRQQGSDDADRASRRPKSQINARGSCHAPGCGIWGR